MRITKNKHTVLTAICQSDFNDDVTVVGHDVWTFSVTDKLPDKLYGKTFSGIVSSLIKKGLAESIDDYDSGDGCIAITQTGLNAIGGDPRLCHL